MRSGRAAAARTPALNLTNEREILMMKRSVSLGVLGLVLLFGSAGVSRAEVRRIQMHIAGYLCGN